jgi:hypothetical protein
MNLKPSRALRLISYSMPVAVLSVLGSACLLFWADDSKALGSIFVISKYVLGTIAILSSSLVLTCACYCQFITRELQDADSD